MPTPSEHKTVQARILHYAQEIGWAFVPRSEAETRRGFGAASTTPAERARKASLFFDDLLNTQVRRFNPKYKAEEGALAGEFYRLQAQSHRYLAALQRRPAGHHLEAPGHVCAARPGQTGGRQC